MPGRPPSRADQIEALIFNAAISAFEREFGHEGTLALGRTIGTEALKEMIFGARLFSRELAKQLGVVAAVKQNMPDGVADQLGQPQGRQIDPRLAQAIAMRKRG